MDVLNKNGQILLDYRAEYKRHYADSVDEALKNSVYLLYKEGKINEKLFRMLLNEDIDDLEVYSYILTQKQFTKSASELNYEFDKVRQKVNDYLISIGLTKNISTKNSLNTNKIVIIKQFDVSKEVLLSFFGLSQTEIIPLMKRRGFMDKFCVLRLNQIFKEIYSELKVPEHIDHGYSLVYYNKDIQGFSIDYKYSLNVNYISDEIKMKELLLKIKDLDRACEKKFQNKLNFAYFSTTGSSKKIKNSVKPVEEIKKDSENIETIKIEKSENKVLEVSEPKIDSKKIETEKNITITNIDDEKETEKKAAESPSKPLESQDEECIIQPQKKKDEANTGVIEGNKQTKKKNNKPEKKVTPPQIEVIQPPIIEIDEDDKDLL